MTKYYDTLLGEHIKNPGSRGLGLDKLAEQFFDYQMISYSDISMKKKLAFQDIDLDKAAIYSGEDVYMTAKLYQKQKSYTDDSKVLEEIELPLLEVIKNMELTGVRIDKVRLEKIGKELEKKLEETKKEIYKKAGTEFNINSPKQVGELLFDKLGLPKGKKTKTGWSVSADVLDNLASEYPIAKDIVDYRHYSKLLSTYISGILGLLDVNDRVHTNYNQAAASTGRFSSTNPNLQNIPTGSGIAGEIRSAFVSRFDSGSIMTLDYSQVEIRILALISGDKNLLQAFNNGRDIHGETAKFLFGDDTIDGEKRKIAKAVNFGVIYGISAFGLSNMIDISPKDAKVYIDKFFESYPKVRDYLDLTIKGCEENGYVETLFGRRAYIAGINDRNKIIKSGAERVAINMPIQGTSADIIKKAMILVASFMKDYKSKMIMQVHDELVFDVYPGEEEALSNNIKKIMENVLKTDIIKLKVDVGTGLDWKQAK